MTDSVRGRIQLALVEHVARATVRDYRKIKPLDQLREVRLNIRPEPRCPHIDMNASGGARQFQARQHAPARSVTSLKDHIINTRFFSSVAA
jgi:hypothetical protein